MVRLKHPKKPTRPESDYAPLDGGHGWAVVFGGALTHFMLVGMARSLGIVFLALQTKFRTSSQQTAWAMALFNTTRSLIAPLCGKLIERFGCRAMTMVGSVVLFSGLLITAFANSIYYVYVSFGIITGSGGAIVFTSAYIIVGQYFDKKKGKAMGIATLGSGLGNIILSPLVTLFVLYYGWFGAMLLLAALQLHHIPAALLYIPLSKLSKLKPGYEDVVKSVEGDGKSRAGGQGDSGAGGQGDSGAGGQGDSGAGGQGDSGAGGQGDSGAGEQGDSGLKTDSVSEVTNGNVAHIDKGYVDDEVQDGKGEGDCTKPLTEKTEGCENTDIESEKIGGLEIKQPEIGTETPKKLEISSRELESGSQELELDKTTPLKPQHPEKLYRNLTFIFYGLMIMSLQASVPTFLIFLPTLAKEYGAEDTQAALALSVMGVADIIGRMLSGFIYDIKKVRRNRRFLYCVNASVFAVCIVCMSLMPNYVAILCMTAIAGIFEGGAHSQRMTILSEFVSADQLATAVGVSIFWQGVGNIWGPPVAGAMRDAYGTSAYGYVVVGSIYFLFTSLFLLQLLVSRRRSEKIEKKEKDIKV